MTVRELIDQLQELGPDKQEWPVCYIDNEFFMPQVIAKIRVSKQEYQEPSNTIVLIEDFNAKI
jgi:hypothetical protein